jgi:hypothetical protein
MYLYSRCRDDQDDDNACEYTYRYSGNAVTKGTLGMDNLVVGGNLFHGVVFGCSDSSAGGGQSPQASGLVGLGRGPLSLVSQLSVRRFMHWRSYVHVGCKCTPKIRITSYNIDEQ